MRITRDDFKRSFFYIGPGFDVEPLFRFTHVTDMFIYVNLLLGKEEIKTWYDGEFAKWGFDVLAYEEVGGIPNESFFDTYPGYMRDLSTPEYLQGELMREYIDVFKRAMREPKYALRYRLRHERLGREVTLFYLTGEGMATYHVMSHNGKFAPRVFCTIQTGMLENPGNPFDNFFVKEGRQHPKLWVRGFSPGLRGVWNRAQVTESVGLFNIPALDFNGSWSAGEWGENDDGTYSIRYCRGFTSKQSKQWLEKRTLRSEFINERHKIRYQDILTMKDSDFSENDVLLVSRHFASKMSLQDKTTIHWEDVTSVKPDDRLGFADDQIRDLGSFLQANSYTNERTIHIIPYCREDQSELYMQSIIKLPYSTVTYVNRLYDMIDLKDTDLKE